MAAANSFRQWGEQPKKQEYRQPRPEERYWRQREEEQKRQQEAERRAKEEAERKAADIKSEVNYPSLGGPRPKTTGLGKNSFAALNEESKPKPSDTFAKLAKTWKKEDDETRERERLRRLQSQREKFSSEGIFIYRPKNQGYGGYADPEEEEQEENTRSGLDDWQEVSHKTYKPKRELTLEELDARARQIEEENEDEYEFNNHLFDNNKHDHY
jgi:hypothetical protein